MTTNYNGLDVWGNAMEVAPVVEQVVVEKVVIEQKSMWREMLEGFDQRINDIFEGMGNVINAGIGAAVAAPGMVVSAFSASGADIVPHGSVATAPSAGVTSALASPAQPVSNVIELPADLFQVVKGIRDNAAMMFAWSAADRNETLGTNARHGIMVAPPERDSSMAIAA